MLTTSTMLLLLLAAFVPGLKANGTGTETRQSGSGWHHVRRGEHQQGIEFDLQRQVWLMKGETRARLFSLVDPDETYDTISISPADPSGRYQMLVAMDDSRPGWLIDQRSRRAYRLPLPDSLDDFVSWSADHKYAVLHTSYEDSDQLWVLRLADRQVREVRREHLRPSVGECCGLDDWAKREGEIAAADESTVRWIASNRFLFRLYTYCSPYEDAKSGPCATAEADDKELRAFVVTVDTETGSVTDKPVAARRR